MKEIELASRLSLMSESATLALNARVKQMAAEGKTIYNLTAGELASDTPKFIQEYVAKTLELNKYTPVAGLPELRRGIAKNAREFYEQKWIEEKNVIVTAGVKPALYAALLALINPGDEVILPTPAWGTYYHLIELVGGVVVEVPLRDNFDLDPMAVASKLTDKTKAIILNSPQNPTGAVFSKSALEQLAAKLSGTDVSVISDDIYAKLVYEGDFTLVPSIGFKKQVIVNGFSKSQALTGWRIGYAIADEPVIKAMTSLLSHIMGNASLPAQEAGLAALTNGDEPPSETLKALRQQRKLVSQALEKMPGIKFVRPGGAFYFFLDLREIADNSAKWCEDLLTSSGVALVPGEAFHAPGFARLTFVTDKVTLEAALKHLAEFVEKKS